jgi:hypothetical protein
MAIHHFSGIASSLLVWHHIIVGCILRFYRSSHLKFLRFNNLLKYAHFQYCSTGNIADCFVLVCDMWVVILIFPNIEMQGTSDVKQHILYLLCFGATLYVSCSSYHPLQLFTLHPEMDLVTEWQKIILLHFSDLSLL